MNDQIISLEQAASLGLTHYFTGEPCELGHISKRYVKGKQCVRCVLDRSRKWHLNNRERALENKARYDVQNKAKLKAKRREFYREHRDEILTRARLWYRENKEHSRKTKKLWEDRNPERQMLFRARKRAVKRGLPFNITLDDIQIPKVCPVIGIPIEKSRNAKGPSMNSPSLDRVIPELGYVRGNVIIVSHLVNSVKNMCTPEQLKKIADFYKDFMEQHETAIAILQSQDVPDGDKH